MRTHTNSLHQTVQVDWKGPGYYRRNPRFVPSEEGFIERDGWRWDKTHKGAPFAHKAESQAQIENELEPMYNVGGYR